MTSDGPVDLDVDPIDPAYVQVAEQLRRRILAGQLSPETRLPNEDGLARMFGVSRSTVREALRVLSSQSLIRIHRGKGGGTFVALPTPELVSGQLKAYLSLLSGSALLSVDELIEARRLLEVPAAGLAATRRTTSQLAEIDLALEAEKSVLEKRRAASERRAFHKAVLAAGNNNLLSVLTTPVFDVLRTNFLGDTDNLEFWARMNDEHIVIRDRIAAGDAAGAEAAMANHLDYLQTIYMEIANRSASEE